MKVPVICLMMQFMLPGLSQAELIMTAPPREMAGDGDNTYGPLAEHLSSLLGEKVTYRQPKNWLEYQRDLRHDVYDIVFDGPHFVSWRIAHLNHEVLVKLPGSLEFVIIVAKDKDYIKGLNNLVGKRICAIPPPNLATLTAIDQFQNPVRQPIIWGVSGGFNAVLAEFKRKVCPAAVFRTAFYNKRISAEDRAGMRVLFQSKALPNQAISVSHRVKTIYKKQIIRSLTLDESGKKAANAIVKRFGGKQVQSFTAASKEEYRQHSLLLEGVVFGW